MKDILDEVWIQRNISTMEMNRTPDFVMIHPINKHQLKGEISLTRFRPLHIDTGKMFGMTVIWTDNIKEDEIVCTYLPKG